MSTTPEISHIDSGNATSFGNESSFSYSHMRGIHYELSSGRLLEPRNRSRRVRFLSFPNRAVTLVSLGRRVPTARAVSLGLLGSELQHRQAVDLDREPSGLGLGDENR